MGKASRKKKISREVDTSESKHMQDSQHAESKSAETIGSQSQLLDIKTICGWAIIILVYVMIRINLIDIPLDRDEGAFGYIGQVIANNGIPYKDALDHKPPVIFYLYSLALLFVQPTSWGIHLFLHIYNFITLLALYLLTKTYFRSQAAGLWSAFVYAIFSASPLIQGFTASTEMFMLLPITLSVLFAVLAARRKDAVYALLSGLSGALACWTKQVAVFSVAFALIYLAAQQLPMVRRRMSAERGVNGKLIIWWFVSAIGTSLLIIGYFFFKGVVNEFFYWSFTHNAYYATRITIGQKVSMFFGWLKNFMREDFIIIGIGLLYGMFIAAKKDVRGYFTLGFLLSSFLGTIPGFAYRHYFAQLAPAVAIAAGFAISEIMRLVPSKGKVAAMLLCGTLVIGVPIVLNRGFYLESSPEKISRNIFGLNPFPESAKIASYISEHTTPNDHIFIYGSEPQILFYAQRHSATPFVMIYPLTFAHPRYQEMQQLAWKDITITRPKFILFVQVPTSILWDRKADLLFARKLRELVDKEYHLDTKETIGGTYTMLLYQKVNPHSLPKDISGG